MTRRKNQINPYDKPRLNRQCQKILKIFRDHGEVSTGQLRMVAAQYNARIYDLRQAGYGIELFHRGSGGNHWYRLNRVKPVQGKLF